MIYSKSIKNLALVLGTVGLCLAINYVIAWTEPTVDPPSGNVSAPVNIGTAAQSKEGNLSIGSGMKYWITKDGDSFALMNDSSVIRLVMGQDGNVGIGTATPGAKLDVNGQIRISGGNPGANKLLVSDANGLASWVDAASLGLDGSDSGDDSDGGNSLPAGIASQTLRHNGTDWVANSVIYNDGTNVGIGTTAPAAKLEINGQIKIAGGSPGAGKVLTSDLDGLASWQTPAPGITAGSCANGLVVKGINSSGQVICGTQISPGTCPANKIMTGIDVSGLIICDDLPCNPVNCASLGYNCGSWPNGCGGTLNCGTCPGGQECSVGRCASSCVPKTCSDLGWTCGNPSDGCGGTLNCGPCPGGKTCVSGTCQDADCRRQSPGKNIFVTGNLYNGSQVRNDSMADAICANEAAAAGLPGTYKAFAYLGGRTPNSILPSGSFYNGHYTGTYCEWVKISNNAAGFTGALLAPIRYDESGNDPGSISVWTGFKISGGSYQNLSLPTSCCGVADQYGGVPACWPCVAGNRTVAMVCPPGNSTFNIPVPTAKAYYGSNTNAANWTGIEWLQEDAPNCSFGGFACKQPINGMTNCMNNTRTIYCVQQ